MKPKLSLALFALAMIIAALAAPVRGGGCPDANGDAHVNVDDLLFVISNWNGPCGQLSATCDEPDLMNVINGWGDCAAEPPDQPCTNMATSGQVNLNDGNASLQCLNIAGDNGIMGENDDQVGLLQVTHCNIASVNAGIYVGHCDEIVLNNVHIQTGDGGNDYTIRGTFARYTSQGCEFLSNGKSWRVYGLVNGGSSTDDVIVGGIMWIGGGGANSWDDQMPFQNFTFRRTAIQSSSVEIMAQTHDVLFDHVDFAGSDHISIHSPAGDLTFTQCVNVPEIRCYIPTAANPQTQIPFAQYALTHNVIIN